MFNIFFQSKKALTARLTFLDYVFDLSTSCVRKLSLFWDYCHNGSDANGSISGGGECVSKTFFSKLDSLNAEYLCKF